MKLTKLEQESLRVALEYAICDYENNLLYYIHNRKEYSFDESIDKTHNESEIKNLRREVKAMQRVQDKLLKEIK